MDTKIKKLILLTILLITASCKSSDDVSDIISKSTILSKKLVIDERDEYKYCQSWDLPDSKIKEYFLKANPISSEEKHMAYYWSACTIEGIFLVNKKSYQFKINAAGTAVVFIDEIEHLFGCGESCKDIFDFGFYEE